MQTDKLWLTPVAEFTIEKKHAREAAFPFQLLCVSGSQWGVTLMDVTPLM